MALINLLQRGFYHYLLSEPFDMVAWLLILLLCIHVVSLALFIFEYASPLGMNRGTPHERGNIVHRNSIVILLHGMFSTSAFTFCYFI